MCWRDCLENTPRERFGSFRAQGRCHRQYYVQHLKHVHGFLRLGYDLIVYEVCASSLVPVSFLKHCHHLGRPREVS